MHIYLFLLLLPLLLDMKCRALIVESDESISFSFSLPGRVVLFVKGVYFRS